MTSELVLVELIPNVRIQYNNLLNAFLFHTFWTSIKTVYDILVSKIAFLQEPFKNIHMFR